MTRNTAPIQHLGSWATVTEWERRAGLSRGVLRYRLRVGWSIRKALATPSMRVAKREREGRK